MTDLGNINSAPLVAFHGSQKEKDAILEQLQQHAAADEITKGIYWENGRGCAVGCTIHGRDHALYEPRFGIPQMLARLEDTIFEGLPNGKAKAWPIRFMQAITPGANLSYVGWQFLHRLLTDETLNPGISHPIVKQAVADVAALVAILAKGGSVDESAARVAESAADSARSAAWSAARSAASAWTAARSARNGAGSTAWSVESAAWSVESAASAWTAAWSAASAAESAWSAVKAADSARSVAWSVESAASAWSAAYVKMADALIQLLEAA